MVGTAIKTAEEKERRETRKENRSIKQGRKVEKRKEEKMQIFQHGGGKDEREVGKSKQNTGVTRCIRSSCCYCTVTALLLRIQRVRPLFCFVFPTGWFRLNAQNCVPGNSSRRFFELDHEICLLYTSPSPRDKRQSRMPSSA